MTKEYDLLVYIGRFQPFHNGHKKVVEYALEKASAVCMLLGQGLNSTRTIQNPWTASERMRMISSCFDTDTPLFIRTVYDHPGDDAVWIKEVIREVKEVQDLWKDKLWSYGEDYVGKVVSNRMFAQYSQPSESRFRTGLIGHEKDDSSFYLKYFPQWKLKEVPAYEDGLNATQIREMFFVPENTIGEKYYDDFIPDSVSNYLINWSLTHRDERALLRNAFIRQEK